MHLGGPDLERIAGGGEVPPHAATCDRCGAEVAALDAARARYLRQHPPAELIRAVRARVARARATRAAVASGALVALAAAGLALWLRPAAPDARPLAGATAAASPTIRAKGGGALLEVRALREGRIFPVTDGAILAAGDRLAFAARLPARRHLLLVGIDDAGAIARYYPPDAGAGPLAPGRTTLPVGLRLDERGGDERLVAVFGPAPPDEAAVRRALAAELAAARGAVRAMRVELPESATVWFHKP